MTVYSANFIELVPYAPWAYPEGSGSVVATPAPKSYPPLSGLFYVKDQKVSLQASPAAGYTLYRNYTADGPASLNPKTTRHPDWVLAYFTPQQTTTIGTNPASRWMWIDGNFWEGPVAWSPFYSADGNWSPGSTHTVDIGVTPQLPYSFSIRFPWWNWSDNGAAAHTITVPTGSSSVTANFGTEYYAWPWAQQPCAGSVTPSPASVDGFYPAGSTVNFTQTPVPGWTFTGWLAGPTRTANPAPLLMDDEKIIVANYNAAAKPVAITSLTPSSKVAGQPAFTLTITGTGFTPNSSVFIGGAYRAAQSITATKIKLKLTAADIATAGALQVFVQTTPPGSWNCAAYDARSFIVRSASAQPLAAASVAKLTFAKQKVGTTSAPQTATLSNGGTTTLAMHDAIVVGDAAADFLVGGNCGNAVSAGGACSASVSFRPTASGTRTARLLFLDSALDSPQVVQLSGTGKP